MNAIEKYSEFLRALGLSETLTSLEESARRSVELLRLYTSSVGEERPHLSIIDNAEGKHGAVAIKNIVFHSFCAHDFVPFFGTVDIVYLPDKKLSGFGSFVRLVDFLSRKPQFQEALTAEIADAIETDLDVRSLLVRSKARQLCSEMRYGNAVETIVSESRRCDDARWALRLLD